MKSYFMSSAKQLREIKWAYDFPADSLYGKACIDGANALERVAELEVENANLRAFFERESKFVASEWGEE